MTTVFYILVYLASVCPNNSIMVDTHAIGTTNSGSHEAKVVDLYNFPPCYKSEATLEFVDSIDDLLAYKNKTAKRLVIYTLQKEPDRIFKVVLENGKFSQKEVKIVPIVKKTKVTIEQEREEIQGYKVE